MNWTAADLRYMADACFDEGVIVADWRIEKYAEELENRNGEAPTEDQVIAYVVAEEIRKHEAEAGSLALYSTAAF